MRATPLTPSRRRRVLAVGVLLVAGGALFGLAAGPEGISAAILTDDVALAVRLPRVVLALLTGAGLATAGAALQALLRNPLADPYVIGVSGGAALGGAVCIAVGAPLVAIVGTGLVEAGAIAGALLATLLLGWFLARDRGRADATLLAGVGLNAFASAIITVLKTTLPAEKAQSLLFWLVGSIDYVAWSTLAVLAPVVIAAIVVVVGQAGALELMTLGEREAARLGLAPRRARRVTYVAASVLVGALVPVTGLIGFVGLVVPHALRITVSGDQRLLLPASALFGAGALALFDGGARLSFALLDTELPTGALTALLGAPFFAAALARHVREARP